MTQSALRLAVFWEIKKNWTQKHNLPSFFRIISSARLPAQGFAGSVAELNK